MTDLVYFARHESLSLTIERLQVRVARQLLVPLESTSQMVITPQNQTYSIGESELA